jgi:hypothetical protein
LGGENGIERSETRKNHHVKMVSIANTLTSHNVENKGPSDFAGCDDRNSTHAHHRGFRFSDGRFQGFHV